MLVVWPAFMAACMLEVLVFAFVDPRELHWFGQELQPSRQSVYTLAFLAFWGISMASSTLLLWLAAPHRFAQDAPIE
ncbi:MAG: hypothetical protein JWP47_2818 [Polaromonas sp.]|jgi:hypothetical protein|nr:hypothetical protein [Polaromonas sp.]